MFQTKNKLDFEVSPWEMCELFNRFRVGTVTGLYGFSKISIGNSYDILAIENHEKGNGHFEDVLQWFEQSCIRDGRSLRFLEVMNEDFKKHLIEKRGFVEMDEHVIKHF